MFDEYYREPLPPVWAGAPDTSPDGLALWRQHDERYHRRWLELLRPKQPFKDYAQFPAFPNPHIRSNGFMVRRERILAFDPVEIRTKLDACAFESGPDSLTARLRRDGLAAVVVGRDGSGRSVTDWPNSGTFRLGEQTNLLISDNQSRTFMHMSPGERIVHVRMTWGDHLAPAPTDFPDFGFKFLRNDETTTDSDPGEVHDRDYAPTPSDPIPYDHSYGCRSGLFGRIADELIRSFRPQRVFDAGCAGGFLVEAFWDRGVEAWGREISKFAKADVRSDLRQYCSVGSIADPIEGKYDFLTCIEVLEHLPEVELIRAVAMITSVTDRIVFSSSPSEFSDPTRINVRPTLYWLRLFAAQGFAADIGYDATFISPNALVLERVDTMPKERDLSACAELVRTRLRVADRERANRELEAERARTVVNLEAERTRANHEEAQLRRAISDLEAQRARAVSALVAERAQAVSALAAERARAISLEAKYRSTPLLRLIGSRVRDVTRPLRRSLKRTWRGAK